MFYISATQASMLIAAFGGGGALALWVLTDFPPIPQIVRFVRRHARRD